MRQLKLKNSKSKLLEEDISKVELELGVKLPIKYAKFLIEVNGGDIYSDVPTTVDGYNFRIRSFFSIDTNSNTFSVQNMFQAINEMFEKKNDWLPFGDDVGDYLFCICLKSDNYGKVYLMRTDEIDESDAFIFVSNSFEEFIDGLQPESEVEI